MDERTEAKRSWRERPAVFAVYVVLRSLVAVTLVLQCLHRSFENAALCLLTLALLLLPSALERRLRVALPDTLEIVVCLFIFASEILGEINAFYTSIPCWDDMLHVLNGFLCAAIGFALVDVLNREKSVSLSLSPFFIAATAFCFSMTVGVLWEFFEFAMDRFFFLDMQKDTIVSALATVELDPAHGTSPVAVRGIADVILVLEDGSRLALGLGGYLDVGLADTMGDLLVNFIGAAVFSTAGYFYVKGRGRGLFVRRFIPRVLGTDGSPPGGTAPAEAKDAPEGSGPA